MKGKKNFYIQLTADWTDIGSNHLIRFSSVPSSSSLPPIIHSGSRVTDSSIVSRCFHTIFTSCQLSHRFQIPRRNICIFLFMTDDPCVDNDDDRWNKLTAVIIIGNFPLPSPPFTEYLVQSQVHSIKVYFHNKINMVLLVFRNKIFTLILKMKKILWRTELSCQIILGFGAGWVMLLMTTNLKRKDGAVDSIEVPSHESTIIFSSTAPRGRRYVANLIISTK